LDRSRDPDEAQLNVSGRGFSGMNKIGIVLAGIVVLVGVSLCLSSVTHSRAAAKESPDSLHQRCESLITRSARGDKDVLIFVNQNFASPPTSAWQKELQEAASRNQAAQLVDFQKEYGSFLGCELSEQKDLSGSVRLCVYMARYEKNVIRWTFVCYRPHGEWKFLAVRFKPLTADLFPQN
jgi:hypothetical protein